MGRKMPMSAEAEQSVIGSMILDSRCVPDVVEILKAEDFFVEHNREIFETLYAMFSFSKPIDPVTLIDEMKQRGVNCNVHFKPLPMMTAYKQKGFDIVDYPYAYNMHIIKFQQCFYDKSADASALTVYYEYIFHEKSPYFLMGSSMRVSRLYSAQPGRRVELRFSAMGMLMHRNSSVLASAPAPRYQYSGYAASWKI